MKPRVTLRPTTALRASAIVIAIAAVIDPALALKRPAPLAVTLHVEAGSSSAEAAKRVLLDLVEESNAASPTQPVAGVVIGDRVDLEALPPGVPIYAVTLDGPPNLRIASYEAPPRARPGRSVVLTVGVESSGLAGAPAVVAVEEAGIEMARAEMKGTAAGVVQVRIPYVPSKSGVSIARVVVRPLANETRQDDNAVDVPVAAADRPLRIAAYEPRPSWSAAFVRRALEDDAAFSVSSLVRVSRGVDARAGKPPARLTLEQLAPFDAILVGAPEELHPPDVDALRAYARVRGGAVILLPDRRPSGAFTALVPSAGFDEVLLEKPASLGGIDSGELALPRQPAPGWFPLAAMPQPSGRPAVLWWPEGDGRLVYSGALDAWRHRARPGESFSRFWRDAIGVAALAAPPRLSIDASPAIVRPGDAVRVRLRLRRTEFAAPSGSSVELPSVTAEAIGPGGRELIRMWPAAEPGLFEGSYRPGAEGRYDLRAIAGESLSADTVLTVSSTAARAPASTGNSVAAIVTATGGITAGEDNLPAIVRHLRARPAPEVELAVHPMRSAWWIVPFAGFLCAEWAIRRRGGLR